jgi:hypothetical protein
MKLQEQVCRLQLAKKLKELGVKQDSLFYWSTQDNKTFFLDYPETYPVDAHYPRPEIICSAFTVAELGEFLPIGFETYKTQNGLFQWECMAPTGRHYHRKSSESEANSRAEMLIYLIGNNLMPNSVPNKETLKVFADTDKGKNLIKSINLKDMFKKLGI